MPFARIESSADQLMATARAMTGIGHDDTDIREPLRRLLESLNAEAELSDEGAVAMQARILRVLCNRLRMLRDIERHPEIEQQRIVQPVILTGAGRTGSTKLHKMLAASGDFQWLPFWQGHSLSLRSGDRGENTDARIRDAQDYIRWFDTQTPEAKFIHPFGVSEPEEEILILEHGMFGLYMMAFAFVPSFIQWSLEHFLDQLRFVKRGLQYLQWQFRDSDPRPWVLKCPLYFGAETVLAEVFPDARFVATHRDPVSTLSSQASLVAYFNKAYSDVDRKPLVGRMMLEGQAMAMQNFMDGRSACPDLPVLDVGYSELLNGSLSAVGKIYAHAGMTLSEDSRAAIRGWEHDNAQNKHGVHAHSLADYGLAETEVREKFRPFIERFQSIF